MSKRYKGKDTHYRLQIKKDGEWQDLGLVASAEMDNKNVDDTTTTNFDEKYIHRNNDKNDGKEEDVKVTDLTFQTSILGRTPKIIFKNTDTSTQDLAEIYLDTPTANKSTLRFVLGDDKGGESIGNNETISFDWRNGEENSRATYYTFTESQLQASSISAHFKQGVFSNPDQNALEVTGHLKMQSGSTICPDNTNGIYFSGVNDQARIYSTTTEAAKIYSTTTRDNQINYSSIGDDSALNITVAGDATKAADSDASALNFLIADNNNDKINFRWSVWDGDAGASNNPINAYTFTKTSLDASTVTAKFNEVHANTIAPNSDHTPITFNSNVGGGWSLTINTDPNIESSIRYSHNGEKQPAWVVGKGVSGREKDFGWWYNDGETGSLKMWLTQDGTLQIGEKVFIYSSPNSSHPQEQTELHIRPNEISFASFDKLSALSYVNGGTSSTDWFKLALGNEGDEPLEFNWVNAEGNVVENRRGWLQYPNAPKRDSDPQLVWSNELDNRLSTKQDQTDNNLITSQKTVVGAINAIAESIRDHQEDTSNPHSVSKAQVGLSNVDNTSDLEKPISNAVKAALDNKSDTSHTHNITDLDGTAERDQYFEGLIDHKADIGHTHLVKDITDMPPITGGGNYINKAWMTDEHGSPGWRSVVTTDTNTTYSLSSELQKATLVNGQTHILTTTLNGSDSNNTSVQLRFPADQFEVLALASNISGQKAFLIKNKIQDNNTWRPITGAQDTDTLAFNSEFFTTSRSGSTFTVSPNTNILITKAFASTTYLGINDTAKNATNAKNAEDAVNAQNADHALYAEEANTALTADKATLADKAKQADNATKFNGWLIDYDNGEVDTQWICAFEPGNPNGRTIRAMDSQLFARKTDLENVKLTATGDAMTPVYINANGQPATTRPFTGLVEASVANNVLTLTIL